MWLDAEGRYQDDGGFERKRTSRRPSPIESDRDNGLRGNPLLGTNERDQSSRRLPVHCSAESGGGKRTMITNGRNRETSGWT